MTALKGAPLFYKTSATDWQIAERQDNVISICIKLHQV